MPVFIPLFVFAAVFLGVLTLARPRDEAVRARLRGAIADTMPRSIQLEQPFGQRAVLPALLGLARVIARYTPSQVVDRTRQQLVMAGLWRTDPLIFLSVRFLLAGAVVFLLLVSQLALHLPALIFMAFTAVAGLVAYFLPVAWLGGRVQRRQQAVVRRFPDSLDLLSVCVEAGLGLDQALEKVSSHGRGPLNAEIRRYLEEVRLGKDRAEAMRDMAARTGVQELHSFVTTLVQAMHLGVSIADVLRVQADYARTMRRQRVEERAMKAPIKVLFPIIVFIFPAIFVAVAGPAAIYLLTTFFQRR